MGRPLKNGLDYFPLDVIFDEKVQAVESVFGNDGLVWIIKFWQVAYRSNNGEVSLDGYHGVIHRDNSRVTTEKHNEIIKLCLEIGLLSKLDDGKYTSNGIKKRLNYIMKERERWRIKHGLEVISPDNPRDNPRDNREETGESKGKGKEYIYMSIFESLWDSYPRREGKKEALRHFIASVKTEKDCNDIKVALENYKASLKETNTPTKYTKMGSTWFNNWKDWINETSEKPKQRGDV